MFAKLVVLLFNLAIEVSTAILVGDGKHQFLSTQFMPIIFEHDFLPPIVKLKFAKMLSRRGEISFIAYRPVLCFAALSIVDPDVNSTYKT